MPSFDIVSQVNTMEIENAVNQAKKELANGSISRIANGRSCWRRPRSYCRRQRIQVSTLNEISVFSSRISHLLFLKSNRLASSFLAWFDRVLDLHGVDLRNNVE